MIFNLLCIFTIAGKTSLKFICDFFVCVILDFRKFRNFTPNKYCAVLLQLCATLTTMHVASSRQIPTKTTKICKNVSKDPKFEQILCNSLNYYINHKHICTTVSTTECNSSFFSLVGLFVPTQEKCQVEGGHKN